MRRVFFFAFPFENIYKSIHFQQKFNMYFSFLFYFDWQHNVKIYVGF